MRGLFAMQCAARGLVAFAWCRRRHAFDGGILRGGIFGLNAHTFNSRHRADRTVEGWLRNGWLGWLRRDGWAEEWVVCKS